MNGSGKTNRGGRRNSTIDGSRPLPNHAILPDGIAVNELIIYEPRIKLRVGLGVD